MKCLALLLYAVCFIASPLQFPTAGGPAEQAGQTTYTATAATPISAEFTKKIDTKDARPGDELSVRTTADATLANGTELRKGTRLAGTVIEVRSKSNANPSSLLAFTIDRAVLQNGQEFQLHSTLTSMSAPAQRAVAENPPDMEAAALGTTPGGRSSGGKSGGSSLRTPPADALAGPTAPVPTGGNDPRAAGASARGNYVSDALQVHHYPVANMPGVILSSQMTASISGALECRGENIRVESGTRMTMYASIINR